MEVVNGTIIGGIWYSGQLFHNGRPQYEKFYGDNDSEIREQAVAFVERLKVDLGDEYKRLYPNGFELRIYE